MVDLLGFGKIKVNFMKGGSILNFYSFNPNMRIPDVENMLKTYLYSDFSQWFGVPLLLRNNHGNKMLRPFAALSY